MIAAMMIWLIGYLFFTGVLSGIADDDMEPYQWRTAVIGILIWPWLMGDILIRVTSALDTLIKSK